MGAKVWHWKKRIGRVLGRLALAVIFFAGVLAQDVLPVSAQQTATTTVKLERGQKLELLVDTTTDSESSKVGDRVEFQLARPVMSGNLTVLPAGWIVTAHVTKVRPAGKSNCKPGAIDWKMDRMTAPDGTKVELVSLRKIYDARPIGPDKVRLPTAEGKFEKVIAAPFIAFIVLISLPLLVPMVLAESSEGTPCRARPGTAEYISAEAPQYAAVTHDARIKVSSGSTGN
jgi:hypothetical protein